MKLLLCKHTDFEIEFNFEIFKKIGKMKLVAGRLSTIDKIGVFLSGGPDSAALLCMIIKELNDTGYLNSTYIHCFIVDKGEGQVIHAINTIKEVERLFNTTIEYTIVEHDPDEGYPTRLGSRTYKFIASSFERMIFYQGINNPPSSDIAQFKSEVPRNYGSQEIREIYGTLFGFPFLHLHKPQILDILYKLNCDSVLKYTQSCYMQSTGSCGSCYSCEERKWGFEILKKRDPMLNTY